MKKTLLFLFSIICFLGKAQELNLAIDQKMNTFLRDNSKNLNEISAFINANFNTENEKIRAIYFYTASSISYDMASLSAPANSLTSNERIEKTMQTHKGVCTDYALVFNELARLVNIQSVIIHGYTKQNGKIDVLSHAWCAAKINQKWRFFDPTWGAGYILNNRFTKKFNNRFYNIQPSQMVQSHIPYDYLWQMLPNPISHQEFMEGEKSNAPIIPKIDFEAEIKRYENLSATDQYFETAQRIEKGGIKNQLIQDAYLLAKKNWGIEKDNDTNIKYNLIVADFNQAISELNDYIYYRNNKFKPNLSDEMIREKIAIPNEKLKKCQADIFKLNSSNAIISKNINQLQKLIADAYSQSEKQLQFVNEYLSKSKIMRKTMFLKH